MKFEVKLFSILLVAPSMFTPSIGNRWTVVDALHQDNGSFNKGTEQTSSTAKQSVRGGALGKPTELASFLPNTPRRMQVTLLADWEPCASSSNCNSGCCTAMSSHDGQLRCTTLNGGYQSNICVGPSPTEQAESTTKSLSAQDATCGYGRRGNGVCPDGTCCSAFGWCGTRATMCEEDAALKTNELITSSTTAEAATEVPTSPTTVPKATWCGNGEIGNGICQDGACCSKDGWCGITVEHCKSRDATIAPTITVLPGGERGTSHETLPFPPIATTTTQQGISPRDRHIIYGSLSAVIFLFLVILAKRTGVICKSSTSNLPADAGSNPESPERASGNPANNSAESNNSGDSLHKTLSRQLSSLYTSMSSLVESETESESELSLAGYPLSIRNHRP